MIELLEIKKGYKLLQPLLKEGESNFYQYPEYFKYYYKSMFFRIIGLKPEFLFLKYRFYCLIKKNESGKVICGFPIKFSKKCNHLYFFWDYKSVNNFIYKKTEFTQETFDSIIQYIFRKFPDVTISFENIDSNTLLYKYIKESKYLVYEETPKEAVSINVSNGYDEWFKSLSKSTKQNIRTAYNRLQKDGVPYEIIHHEGPNSFFLIRKLMYLQRKRNLEKSNRKYGSITKMLCYIGSWLSLINPRTLLLIKSNHNFLTIVLIDKKIAAFCAGFYSANGRFFIPFLKYNSEFGRYSPGGLVINECIKRMLQLKTFKLQQFDLMMGSETYKYTYGGLKYENIYFDIKKNGKY